MKSHLYIVNYGVNNSHHCEASSFNLYRDAVDFFNNIDLVRFPSGTVNKVTFDGDKGFEIAVESEIKIARYEPGVDNTCMLASNILKSLD